MEPPLRIRPATSSDGVSLSALGCSCFGEATGAKLTAAVRDVGIHTGVLGQPVTRSVHAAYWVAEHPVEGVLGVIGLYSPRWIGRQNLYLGWYCVMPEHQGQGIGRSLFDHALEEARRLSARALFVETSPDPPETVRFYEKLGFRAVGQCPDYWEGGGDLLLMRLPLEPGTR